MDVLTCINTANRVTSVLPSGWSVVYDESEQAYYLGNSDDGEWFIGWWYDSEDEVTYCSEFICEKEGGYR